MLTFKREGSKATIWVDVKVPRYEERSFPLRFDCGNEVYAGFLTTAIEDAIGDAVRKAREEAYNEGWRDAKAKRSKESWFRRHI